MEILTGIVFYSHSEVLFKRLYLDCSEALAPMPLSYRNELASALCHDRHKWQQGPVQLYREHDLEFLSVPTVVGWAPSRPLRHCCTVCHSWLLFLLYKSGFDVHFSQIKPNYGLDDATRRTTTHRAI